MQIGMVGLGKMGGSMARRILQGGHEVVGFDLRHEAVEAFVAAGGRGATTYDELITQLAAPRVIWLMIPPGKLSDTALAGLSALVGPGDVVVDGGNANFRDSLAWAATFSERGVHFVDVGVSGGIWGFTEGFGLLLGGDPTSIERLRPICESLCAPGGFAHVGPSGAGHYAKMIHNAVEYGVMQAYAEGFELLAASELGVDVPATIQAWGIGCSIRSWILQHFAKAIEQNPKLEGVRDWVGDSGQGRWSVGEAVRLGVPVPAISAALFARFTSQQETSPAMKALSAIRAEIGGHVAKPSPDTGGASSS